MRTLVAHVLTSVSLTCRNRPQVDALSHVLANINCIDVTWTLESASERQLVSLMDRFGKLVWPGVDDHEFREKRFLNGAIKAAEEGRFERLPW